MERLILNDLLKWKESKYRKPLILKGVRQVGKTWVLKEFGKRYYENTAYLFISYKSHPNIPTPKQQTQYTCRPSLPLL